MATAETLFDKAARMLARTPCRRQVAALPWRKAGGGIELMLITSRDTGRWVVPKGWPEKGESLSQAAAREAGEEAGLRGSIATEEAGRYFYAKALASGERIACEVLVYPLEVKRVAETWKESGQRNRKWMSVAAAAAAVREPDLATLILAFGGARNRVAATA